MCVVNLIIWRLIISSTNIDNLNNIDISLMSLELRLGLAEQQQGPVTSKTRTKAYTVIQMC